MTESDVGRSQQSSGAKTKYRRALTSLVALRHGRPGSKLRCIVVAGDYGTGTVVRLIAELLSEAGKDVVEITPESSDARYQHDMRVFQRELAEAQMAKAHYVVIEVTQSFINMMAHMTIRLDTVVALTDCPAARELIKQPLKHVVAPCGMEVPGVEVHNVMTFGRDEQADMRAQQLKQYRKGTEVTYSIDQHDEVMVATHLLGWRNAGLVAAALAVAYVLGVKPEDFGEAVANVESIPGNLQYLDAPHLAFSVITDSGMTPVVIENSLETARAIARRRVIVGLAASVDNERLAQYKKDIDRLIYVGETDLAGVTRVHDADEAALVAMRAAKQDDLVLLLGSAFVERDADGHTVAERMAGIDA